MSKRNRSTRPGTVLRVVRDGQGRKLAEVFVSTGLLRPRQFYFRVLGGNAQIMAASEGYVTLTGACEGFEDLRDRLASLPLGPIQWEYADLT